MEAAKDRKAQMQDDEAAWQAYRQVLHAYTVMQPFVSAFVDGRFDKDGSIVPAKPAAPAVTAKKPR